MKHLIYTILLLSLTFFLSAQTAVGFVVDEDGEPIPYASVYVKKDPVGGTMTDLDGRYELQLDTLVKNSDEVVFSFIGYRTEIFTISTITSDSVFYITLVEQPIMLEGAVVKAKISKKESRKLKRSFWYLERRNRYFIRNRPCRIGV